MKKLLSLTLAVLAMFTGFATQANADETSYDELYVAFGSPFTANATVTVGQIGVGLVVQRHSTTTGAYSSNLARSEYSLTSSDTGVMIITDASGTENSTSGDCVKAVGAGQVTITASTTDGLTGSVSFVVSDGSSEYDNLRIAAVSTLTAGTTYGLAVFGQKDNVDKGLPLTCGTDYTLVSSNTDVLEVIDNVPTVKAKTAGEATLTATLISNEKVYGTWTITVTESLANQWDAKDVLKGKTLTAYASSTREGNPTYVVGSTQGMGWSSCAWTGTESSITHNETTGYDEGNDASPWWFVDLGREYNASEIAIYWANCYAATYEVVTASALKDGETVVSNETVDWNSATVQGNGVDSNISSINISSIGTGIRFIKIHGLVGGGLYTAYGMRFTRFYLDGEVANPELVVPESLDNGKAVCSGDWVEETFLSNDVLKTANVIDLTGVSGVPTDFTAKIESNPNAIIYASSSVSGRNVCTGIGANVATLELVDGYDFAPEQWFNVTDASYTVTLSAKHYTMIYIPFGVSTVSPDGLNLYDVQEVSSSVLTLKDATFGKEKAYIAYSENGGEFTISGSNTQCGSTASGHDTPNNGTTIVGTLTKTTVPSDGTAYMFNKNGELAKVTGTSVILYPFAGYLTGVPASADGSAAKLNVVVGGGTTGIESAIEVNADDANAQTYNIAGQAVGHNYKGIVIRNGKKFFNK